MPVEMKPNWSGAAARRGFDKLDPTDAGAA